MVLSTDSPINETEFSSRKFLFKRKVSINYREIFIKKILFEAKFCSINMENTTYCDICNHEYKRYKNNFKPTNTHLIFSDKYLHLNEKQNIVMSVLRMS